MMCGYLSGMAVFGAMVRDNTPVNKTGMFQGLRICGQVLIPGVIGPAIGAAVLKNAPQILNSDGTYSFTAPVGVTEVILAVKGDVSGDGRVNVGDVSKLYAHVKQTNMLTGDALFVADVSNDGRINIGDVSKLYGHCKGTNVLTWDT
jgi:hypothetical protein